MTDTEYRVRFGQIARTVVYEDKLGTLLLTFDVTPAVEGSEKKWNLILGKRPLVEREGRYSLYERDPSFKRERVESAVERVIGYVSSCGYFVSTE